MYREIQKYVSNAAYWKLITTSKALFSKIKYETRKINIRDDEDVEKFLTDESFQQSILERIQSPANQLQLTDWRKPSLSYSTSNLPIKCDLDLSFSLFSVFDCDENPLSMPNLSGRRVINLDAHSAVTNFNGLSGVEEMKLSHLEALCDVTGLNNLYKLTLEWCSSVTDLSCLGHLHEITVMGCPGVTTTTGLSKVPRLFLYNLENLESLDPLTAHDYLIVEHSKKIEDLTPLRGVRVLTTDYIGNLQDCENLLHENGRLESLHLSNYQEKEGHPGLARLKFVGFASSSIESLIHLKDVPKLSFSVCSSLKDLTPLIGGKIRSIQFSYCNSITDFSPCQGIPFINIHTRSSYPFPDDMTMFSQTRHLSLTCDMMSNIPPVSFKGVEGIESLELGHYCAMDIPETLATLTLTKSEFFSAAGPMLGEIECPRIVLKEQNYEEFMKNVKGHIVFKQDPTAFEAGPYEMIDDPVDKQVVLLKKANYTKPDTKDQEEPVSAFGTTKVFYHLFGVVPPKVVSLAVRGGFGGFQSSANPFGNNSQGSNPFAFPAQKPSGFSFPSTAPAPAFSGFNVAPAPAPAPVGFAFNTGFASSSPAPAPVFSGFKVAPAPAPAPSQGFAFSSGFGNNNAAAPSSSLGTSSLGGNPFSFPAAKPVSLSLSSIEASGLFSGLGNNSAAPAPAPAPAPFPAPFGAAPFANPFNSQPSTTSTPAPLPLFRPFQAPSANPFSSFGSGNSVELNSVAPAAPPPFSFSSGPAPSISSTTSQPPEDSR